MKEKVCKNCTTLKKLGQFYKHKGMKDGHVNTCKACQTAANSARQQSCGGREAHNKACRRYGKTQKGKVTARKHRGTVKKKLSVLRHQLKKKYALTLEQFDAMLEEQLGLCAICGQPETHVNRYDAVDRLSVDHDHETGKVRGLLCRKCNIMLMGAKDDVHILRSAIRYLI